MGIRCAGIPGAVIATLGCILPACVLVSVLAKLYQKYHSLDLMQGILSALRPVVVALIATAGLNVLREALFSSRSILLQNMDWAAAACFIAAFLLIRKAKWNPIGTMALSGAAYTVFHLITGG